jgi:hypothetical protein
MYSAIKYFIILYSSLLLYRDKFELHLILEAISSQGQK